MVSKVYAVSSILSTGMSFFMIRTPTMPGVPLKICTFECIHEFVPSKKSRRREKNPWITDEIIELARRKKRLYSKSRKSPDNFTI